jgi:hypothetical protein
VCKIFFFHSEITLHRGKLQTTEMSEKCNRVFFVCKNQQESVPKPNHLKYVF